MTRLFDLMKTVRLASIIITTLAVARACFSAEPAPLDSHLEPLRPLLEKTWKGQFKDSKPDKPTVDIARWERALNGRAVRILHSINDGIYGGESLVMWDEKKQQVGYYYFTTAGFTTTGTMRFEDGKFMTREVATGSSEGITEVRGVSEITPDGSFHVKSEYLKNGKWVPGHEVTYREDTSAKVVFQ
jgi:hypothetical protein